MDSGRIIRFCLVGLPVGLVLITASSIFVTEWIQPRRESAADPRQQQYAAMMRKPVSREDLETYVRILSQDIGERHLGKMENLKAAAYFIESSLGPSNMGYQVQRQKYQVEGHEVWNLEVTVPGSGKENGLIVIGAHYDTVPGSPGADDNASGVAALLSLANAFIGTENEMTLKFVAFVNEEMPWAKTENMGSLVYAKALKKRGEKVKGMISLDSLGVYSDKANSQRYPDASETKPDAPETKAPSTGNFLMIIGNQDSAELVKSAAKAMQGSTSLPVLEVIAKDGDLHSERSDHWAFWQTDYPALLLTDTGPFRYQEYHKAGDVMDRLNMERLEEAVKGIQATIESLAGSRREN